MGENSRCRKRKSGEKVESFVYTTVYAKGVLDKKYYVSYYVVEDWQEENHKSVYNAPNG